MDKSKISLTGQFQRAFVVLIIVIHCGWIINHLRWVASDEVNPWKLGGYGMYTVPDPRPLVSLNIALPSGETRRISSADYNFREFRQIERRTNPSRIFRCAHMTPESIRAFFDENPKLHGFDLAFIYTERQFLRNPVVAKRVEQGRVQIQWIGARTLVYASQFCGNVETGEVSWP